MNWQRLNTTTEGLNEYRGNDLEQITARLAELDEEARAATDAEVVNKAADEKKELLARKAELEALNSANRPPLKFRAVLLRQKSLIQKEENQWNLRT